MSLGVDMDKARTIHMNVIRRARNLELEKEDVAYMKAVELGDASEQATVAARKQALRDIPTTLDLITDVTTTDELKARWPSELPIRG